MQFFEGRLKNITFSWSSQRSILNDRTDESIFFSFPTGNIRFLDLLSTKKKKKVRFSTGCLCLSVRVGGCI